MASTQGTDAAKSALRRQHLLTREGAALPSCAQEDASLIQQLLSSDLYRDADMLLTFVSYAHEVNTHALIEQALSQGKRVACPRCNTQSKTMQFFEISSRTDLYPQTRGILEPDPSRTDALSNMYALQNTICVVPALVVDAKGARIGYGGGYYDKFLATYPGKTLTLARSTMISGTLLPQEAHDIRIDYIVTSQGLISTRTKH